MKKLGKKNNVNEETLEAYSPCTTVCRCGSCACPGPDPKTGQQRYQEYWYSSYYSKRRALGTYHA